MSSPAEKLREMNRKLGVPNPTIYSQPNFYELMGKAQCPECNCTFPVKISLQKLILGLQSQIYGKKGQIEQFGKSGK